MGLRLIGGGVGVAVGEGGGFAVGEGDGLGIGVGATEGLDAADGVGVAVGEGEGSAVGESDGFGVAIGATEGLGVADGAGATVSAGKGVAVGEMVEAGGETGGDITSIGVGRTTLAGGMVTPGGGASTRRRLRGPGLIGRTGSMSGAWGRERGDCLGDAVAVGGGFNVSVEDDDALSVGVGVSTGNGVSVDEGDGDGVGVEETEADGFGEGDVFFFVVLCFFRGAGLGPVKSCLILSPKVCGSSARELPRVARAKTSKVSNTIRNFIRKIDTLTIRPPVLREQLYSFECRPRDSPPGNFR